MTRLASALGWVLLLSLPALPALGASCSSSTTATPGGASSSGSSGSSGSAGTDPSTTDPPPTTTLFTKAFTSVAIEIDYATGAAPFMGALKNFGDPWVVSTTNVDAIFDGKKKVTLPTTLAQMEALPDVTATTFTQQDLLAVASAHRSGASTATEASFYVVFVNGTYVDDAGAPHPETLGVSIGQTGVVGMFKPAITTAVVEQLALVHQLAHAMGFVDNGVPVGAANAAHVDTTNVHHCTRTQCALGFTVESAAGAKAFADANMHNATSILIGQECLSDARILENSE